MLTLPVGKTIMGFDTNPQEQILKKLTSIQKLEAMNLLWHSARIMKRAGIKMLHPDWEDEKVERRLREIFLYART